MSTATLNAPSGTATIGTMLDTLGRLLSYPGADFEELLAQASDTIDSLPLIAFCGALGALDQDTREELYTATFDVTPQCVPYVSIHLFGEENFKRGEFMAALHNRYAMLEFDTGGELPDHIALMFRHASQLDESERRELIGFCVLGPLDTMIRMLAEDHPYRFLLDAAVDVLHAHYPDLQPALSPLEQMRRHGSECPTVSAACNCGVPPSAEPSAHFSTMSHPAPITPPP